MRVAVWQCAPFTTAPGAALSALDRTAAEAARQGADLLVTPEMLISGYCIGAEAAARLARPRGGEYHRDVAAIARAHGVAIAFGYPEAAAGGTRNAAALIDAHGATLLDYAKTHLWSDPDRGQFVAGEALSPVVAFNGWRVALAICFDIEFPEVARALALAGAELILSPTACSEPWRSAPLRLIPARAEENGIFVAYANYVGREAAIDYCGHSCLCGPDGEDLARAALEPALITGDMDRAAMERRRREIPYLDCRLPGLYGPLVRRNGD